MEPLFSIICPTFNRAALLRRAIDSALNQKYSKIELIIVNDGSIDNTKDVVSSYSDERVVYLEHEKNMGLNAAINTGFRRAKGRYIAKLDDDDELAEVAVNTAIDTFESVLGSNIRLLFFNSMDVEANSTSGKSLPDGRVITYEDLLRRTLQGDYWVVVDSTVLPSNEILDENSWGTMGPLWLRLLRNCNAYYMPKTVYFAHRQHEMKRLTDFSASRGNWQRHEHYTISLLDEFGKDMRSVSPETYARQLQALAFYQLMNRKFDAARSSLILSLRINLSLGASALLALSFVGKAEATSFIYRRLVANRFIKRLF